MTLQQIQQLERQTKSKFYNKNIEKKEFWDIHISQVILLAKKLAKKYKADLKVVWLSAILHDLARLNNKEPHDVLGAKTAYN